MISHELAKKLKDAGFPQNGLNVHCVHENSVCTLCKEYSYIPSLSELIEACGERFDKLCRYKDDRGLFWKCWGKAKGMIEIYETSTPEEAVANLWLELNKK
jgi:hypothetical protein